MLCVNLRTGLLQRRNIRAVFMLVMKYRDLPAPNTRPMPSPLTQSTNYPLLAHPAHTNGLGTPRSAHHTQVNTNQLQSVFPIPLSPGKYSDINCDTEAQLIRSPCFIKSDLDLDFQFLLWSLLRHLRCKTSLPFLKSEIGLTCRLYVAVALFLFSWS